MQNAPTRPSRLFRRAKSGIFRLNARNAGESCEAPDAYA